MNHKSKLGSSMIAFRQVLDKKKTLAMQPCINSLKGNKTKSNLKSKSVQVVKITCKNKIVHHQEVSTQFSRIIRYRANRWGWTRVSNTDQILFFIVIIPFLDFNRPQFDKECRDIISQIKDRFIDLTPVMMDEDESNYV